MPIIRALCTEAMQHRHWAQLFEECEMELDVEEGLTLAQLLEHSIRDHLPVVESISDTAMKQWVLKCALTRMKADWKKMELETVAVTGGHLLKDSSVEAIKELLDAHLVETHQVRSSHYVKPIEKEVKDWEIKLIYMQDVLEEWLHCQRGWLLLDPIFNEALQEQMRTEHKRFAWVSNLWRTTMEQVIESPVFMDISDVIDNLLQSFHEANTRLDKVRRSLTEYLEAKRVAFPRFFFLSSEELLQVLGLKTPAVEFMPRIFAGISALHIEEGRIRGMVSDG
jgi:dynein heavy chain